MASTLRPKAADLASACYALLHLATIQLANGNRDTARITGETASRLAECLGDAIWRRRVADFLSTIDRLEGR